ncbi:MAG: zf-HC2 domain-containing protein [Planctomycetes bacterium]|nr:zf-HC2 domain-containing protein [Planctomycetota bacterium]
MTCEHCRNLLFEYIEGLVEDPQRSPLEGHLQGCEACRQEEQALEACSHV